MEMVTAEMQDGCNSYNIDEVQCIWHKHIIVRIEEVEAWYDKYSI